jgi:hypothetical protein
MLCWLIQPPGRTYFCSRLVSLSLSFRTCVGGHLKIFDGLKYNASSFPPTVLCGYHEAEGPMPQRILVKRFTSQTSSKVEFFVLKANTRSGFDIEVTFYDKRKSFFCFFVFFAYNVMLHYKTFRASKVCTYKT